MNYLHPPHGGALHRNVRYVVISKKDLTRKGYTPNTGSSISSLDATVAKTGTAGMVKMKDDLLAASAEVFAPIQKGPEYAILLTESTTQLESKASIQEFSAETLEKVIGVSWIAAMKLMGELDDIQTSQPHIREFAQNIFLQGPSSYGSGSSDPGNVRNVRNVGEPDISTQRKATIIAFVNGVHVYALATGHSMPAMKDSLYKKYMAVLEYLKNTENASKVENIWKTLNEFYSKVQMGDESKKALNTLISSKNIGAFLNAEVPEEKEQEEEQKKEADEGGNDTKSRADPVGDDLSAIAKYHSIHNILFRRKK